MAIVKNNQLIKDLLRKNRFLRGSKHSDLKFIIDKYFEYAIPALLHGFKINGSTLLPISLGFISYSRIPARYKRLFTYSEKLYGYTFIPKIDNNALQKYQYNYKPSKALLNACAEMSETDNVYRLLTR